jgi:hypothetical protein
LTPRELFLLNSDFLIGYINKLQVKGSENSVATFIQSYIDGKIEKEETSNLLILYDSSIGAHIKELDYLIKELNSNSESSLDKNGFKIIFNNFFQVDYTIFYFVLTYIISLTINNTFKLIFKRLFLFQSMLLMMIVNY